MAAAQSCCGGLEKKEIRFSPQSSALLRAEHLHCYHPLKNTTCQHSPLGILNMH